MNKKPVNILKELKEQMFPDDETADSKIYQDFKDFIEDKDIDIDILQIIGLPGIGKTHQLIKIFEEWDIHNFKDDLKKTFFGNQENFEAIKDQNYVFIDGVNEFDSNQKQSLLKIINFYLKEQNDWKIQNHSAKPQNEENLIKQQPKKQKFILTSWDPIKTDYSNRTKIIRMQSKPDVEKLLNYYDFQNISEQNKYILKTLTYRQLRFLLKHMDRATFKNNAWDSMQKAFENLMCEIKIKDLKTRSVKWKYFKDHFVTHNSSWPYIKKENLDKQWEFELKRLAIIQKKNDKKYFINNCIFLLPIKLRKYTNKNTIVWLNEYIKDINEDESSFIHKIIIIVRYLVARKEIQAIEWLLQSNEMKKFPASKISETIFMFSEIENKSNHLLPKFNIENLKFDTLYALFDLFPFISGQTALDFVSNSKMINFDIEQGFPSNSSKKYSHSLQITQFKKLLIGIVMNIYKGYNKISDVEIWRLLNMEKFKGIKIKQKYIFHIGLSIRETMIQTLIAAGFNHFGLDIFGNKNELLELIKRDFFLCEYTNKPKTEIKRFEWFANNFLENWLKSNKKHVETLIDNIIYLTDKSTLASVSRNLNKIDDLYKAVQLKNNFLKPLITYVIFRSDENVELFQIKKINDNDLKNLNDLSIYSKPLSQETYKKIKISRMIPVFLKYMLTGNFFYWRNNGATPYFKVFDNKKNKGIATSIKNICNNYLNISLFLNKYNIYDIYKETIINKNGIKFYPIFIEILQNIFIKNYKFQNCFMIRNNIETIADAKISLNNWWVPIEPTFPFCPTKGDWNFDEKEFLFFEKCIKNTYSVAIYTSNSELLDRFYEFYADSTKHLPYTSGVDQNALYKEKSLVINHRTQKYFNSSEEYEANNIKFGCCEYKKYLTKAELKKLKKIEEIRNKF